MIGSLSLVSCVWGMPRVTCSVSDNTSRQDLQGETVVVVGLGVSGRAAVKLALARGARVVGVDKNPATVPLEKDPSFELCDGSKFKSELGPHNFSTFRAASRLVISPGVAVSQPDVAAAIQAGVPAVSELAFAAEVLPKKVKVAAVTGTNGKSTVTTFTGQLLREAGVRTFVGGNLGTPLSDGALQCMSFPVDDPPFQAAVVEISSYQLELPGSLSPAVAVVLNLSPDHLDRHATLENYGTHKCRLFAKMTAEDLAVIPRTDVLLRKLALQSGGKGTRGWLDGLPGVQLDSSAKRAIVLVPTTDTRVLLDLSSLKAVGTHNAHNAGTAALLALGLNLGLDQEVLQGALPMLQPPPHRMEIVCRDQGGVLWVNDSKATNVEATYTGVKGLAGKRAVVLLGGLAKDGVVKGKLGFHKLVEVLEQHRAVVTFGASGEQIARELKEARISIPVDGASGLEEAVKRARAMALNGDIVLLSPGCASFDEFSNFEHRGRVFASLARCTSYQ